MNSKAIIGMHNPVVYLTGYSELAATLN